MALMASEAVSKCVYLDRLEKHMFFSADSFVVSLQNLQFMTLSSKDPTRMMEQTITSLFRRRCIQHIIDVLSFRNGVHSSAPLRPSQIRRGEIHSVVAAKICLKGKALEQYHLEIP